MHQTHQPMGTAIIIHVDGRECSLLLLFMVGRVKLAIVSCFVLCVFLRLYAVPIIIYQEMCTVSQCKMYFPL